MRFIRGSPYGDARDGADLTGGSCVNGIRQFAGSLRRFRAVDAKAAGGTKATSVLQHRKTQYEKRKAFRCMPGCRERTVEEIEPETALFGLQVLARL